MDRKDDWAEFSVGPFRFKEGTFSNDFKGQGALWACDCGMGCGSAVHAQGCALSSHQARSAKLVEAEDS